MILMTVAQSSMVPDVSPVLRRVSARLLSSGICRRCESGSWDRAAEYAVSASAYRPSLNISVPDALCLLDADIAEGVAGIVCRRDSATGDERRGAGAATGVEVGVEDADGPPREAPPLRKGETYAFGASSLKRSAVLTSGRDAASGLARAR